MDDSRKDDEIIAIATEAFWHNNDLLQKMIDMLPIGVWIHDASGKIIHGNPEAKAVWSGAKYVGPDEFGEYKAWHIDSGDPIKPDEWAAAKAISEGKVTINEEIEIEAFDGTRKIILNSAFPIRDSNQRIAGAIILNQDITIQRENQARLEISNGLLTLFSKASSHSEYIEDTVILIRKWTGCEGVGIRVIDEYDNIPYEAYAGYSEEFLEQESLISIKKHQCICTRIISEKPDEQEKSQLTEYGSFHTENAPKFMDELSAKTKKRYSGACLDFGYKSIAATPIRYRGRTLGAIHYVDSREGKITQKTVQMVEFIAPFIGEAINRYSIEDEFRRNFKALKENQIRLELALDGANMALWEWHVQTGEAYYSTRFARLFGYSFRDVKPHVSFWESLVHPDDLPRALRAINDHLEGKTPSFEAEYRMKTKSGDWKWVISRGKVVERDSAGKPVKVTRTILDITDHRNAEDELRRRNGKD